MASDYGSATKTPAIPNIRSGTVEQALQAMKEWIEVRQGARGDGLDRAVTLRDLLNSGVVDPQAILGISGASSLAPLPGAVPQPAVPPTPENLLASGAVASIILTWTFAIGYTRLSHFEIWRSATDALGDAALIGQTDSRIYTDETGPSASFYYWVRAVSDAGVSAYSSLSGVLGVTAIDVAQVHDAIEGSIDASGLLDQLTVKTDADGLVSGYGLASTPSDDAGATTFTILADRFLVSGPAAGGVLPATPFLVQATAAVINGVAVPKGVYIADGFIQNGTITNAKIGNLAVDDAKIASMAVDKLQAGKLRLGSYIESSNFLSGSAGFHIGGDGTAELSNAVVRGTVYATAGLIGGNRIDAQGVGSPNYVEGQTGWNVSPSGYAEFNNATVRGHVEAATGTFSGQIQASQVKASEFMTGAFTGYGWPTTGSGTYLGPDGLLIGNANVGKYFQVTGDGNIYAPGFKVENGQFSISQLSVIDTLRIAGNAVTTYAGVAPTIGVPAHWNNKVPGAIWGTSVSNPYNGFVFITVALSNVVQTSGEGDISLHVWVDVGGVRIFGYFLPLVSGLPLWYDHLEGQPVTSSYGAVIPNGAAVTVSVQALDDESYASAQFTINIGMLAAYR